MRFALPILLALLLTGCPGKQVTTGATAKHPQARALSVTLLCTDLGLADGEMVREADKSLSKLDQQNGIKYTRVGELPPALESEGGTGDVGLPGAKVPPGVTPTGLMSAAEAAKLAGQLQDSDVVIVSGPVAAGPVLARIQAGTLKAGTVVMLDGDGPKATAPPGVKLITVDYDIKEAAYLLGVAAGVSSRSQAFVAITSTLDPDADVFLKAFQNGVHNRMRGGNVYAGQITPNADNIVSPKDFDQALGAQLAGGSKVDHYIIAAGRATPSIMYALSSKPYNGYLLGGYGDFRQVRPARVVGCIVKHPGVALEKLFADWDAAPGKGSVTVGFADGGVTVTDFDTYAHYNQDAGDIADAVKAVRSEIEGEEIDVMQ